ncbi:DUF2271 domain-containing protein [Novipirellula sp.]|uniref:DUF2271 domain-containing protein n=1 Tax=Novipirellula sp. TaxID=2795430 RepID=UPI00356214EB
MKLFLAAALLTIGFNSIAKANDDTVQLEATVEIPKLNVSEYHRPYVAVWVQDQNRNVVANLVVWYQMKKGNEGEGTKWLPDLRQWWRRSGRSLELPIDGVTGATRPAGKHTLKFASKDKQLAELASGEYELIVEAAREVGGREMVQIPFTWPPEKIVTRSAAGKTELGEVLLTVKP